MINFIPFCVLASKFNVESKNRNYFAGEPHDFFWSKFIVGTVVIFNCKVTPLWFFDQKNHDVPQQKVHIFDSASNSEAKTPNEITIIAQR